MPTFGFESTAEQVTDGLDLRGTTWLVTGFASGIGRETARVLALRGGHIVGLARDEAKARAALVDLGIDGLPVACELGDLTSVRAAVASLRATGLRFRGLIANAGIMALPTLEQIQGVEKQLFTNHVGHFVLVTGLLDRLTDDGRVVVLSSGAHHLAAERGLELDNTSGATDYHPWRLYGRSKLANILFAKGLARRFQGTSKTANAVHPGVIRTNLARHVADPEALFERMKNNLKSIPQGAATTCYVATRPELAEVSGQYFADCAVAEIAAPGREEAAIERLWAWTEATAASA